MSINQCNETILAYVNINAVQPKCECLPNAIPEGDRCVCDISYFLDLNQRRCVSASDCISWGLTRTLNNKCVCVENAHLMNGICACKDGYTASDDKSMCQLIGEQIEGRTASTKETFIVATTLGMFMALTVAVLVVLTIMFKRRKAKQHGDECEYYILDEKENLAQQ